LLTFADLATARHTFRFWWHATLRVVKRNARTFLGYGFVSAEENFLQIIIKLFTGAKSREKVRKTFKNRHEKTRFREPG